ncbi:hypothetical protein [Kribbella sp. CA-294648]|uniref:hypothetical protein n=1 Tax=Kribbella sp. CA-294648 TaxID=3239948 RepID=UPI003D8A1554
MTQTLSQSTSKVARPAWLFLVALVAVVAFVVTANATIVADSAGEMTAAQVEDRALQWIVMAVLWMLSAALGAVAFMAIAARLGGSRPVTVLARVGKVILLAYVAAQAGVVWIDDAEVLGDSSWLALAILLSLLGWWLIVVAAILTCRRLFQSRVAPRTALVIGVLTALYVVLEVAVYLPALIGEQELHETMALPSIVPPVLWAILGGVLLRKQAWTRAQVPG